MHQPLFLEQAKLASKISNEIVAFSMSRTSTQSFADIGAINNAGIKDSDASNIVYLNVKATIPYFWALSKVQAIKIGDSEKTTQGFTAEYNLAGYEEPAIVDTGTSLIYAPSGLGEELVQRLARGSQYLFDPTSGLTVVSCDEKDNYQDFYLTIDDAQFKILAEDYFMTMTTTNETTGEKTTTCFLGIVSMIDLNYWLIGDVFLRGYYSIFDNADHNAARMGFAPHATSTKPKVV